MTYGGLRHVRDLIVVRVPRHAPDWPPHVITGATVTDRDVPVRHNNFSPTVCAVTTRRRWDISCFLYCDDRDDPAAGVHTYVQTSSRVTCDDDDRDVRSEICQLFLK